MSKAKSDGVRINIKWLRAWGACERYVAVVEAEIGASTVTLTRARLLKADALGLNLSWLLRKLLHSPGVGRRRKLTAAEVKRLFGFMTRLNLNESQIGDISVLAGLTNLTYLYLGGNHIGDISALAGLTKLTYLDLGVNHIGDISVLASLPNLTCLYLSGNPLNAAAAGVIAALKEKGVIVYA